MRYQRIFTIVLDSFGVGQAQDANQFGDFGADTYGHIQAHMSLHIPNLRKLGLDALYTPQDHQGIALRLAEHGASKDTLSGHWELMGVVVDSPFQVFSSFPDALIETLEQATNHTFIGNKAASGTQILAELGHVETETNGSTLILYTSADSVLQICGNEEIIGLEELYRVCQTAREITMQPQWKVGRVIARPYIIRNGQYIRTDHRKDYAVAPIQPTVLDYLPYTIGIGKISDIFSGQGISESYHSTSSVHGMKQTIAMLEKEFRGLCFTNLVDFDAKWGHRRDVEGYGHELEQFDVLLGECLKKMKKDDLLILTADHGNDPTWKGTDHTRENVPCLCYSPQLSRRETLPIGSFGDVGSTILYNFGVVQPTYMIGEPIWDIFKP